MLACLRLAPNWSASRLRCSSSPRRDQTLNTSTLPNPRSFMRFATLRSEANTAVDAGGAPIGLEATMPRQDKRSAEAIVYRRLYRTARWKRLREAKLRQDPLCEWCLEREIVEPATEVHHDGAHRGDIERFFEGPFVSTCKPCH